MKARWFAVAAAVLSLSLAAAAIEPEVKKPAGGGSASADLDQRLAAMEKLLTAALQEVQGLRKEVQAMRRPGAGGGEARVQVYTLRNAEAGPTAKLVAMLLQEKEGEPLKIAADERTNTVLAAGRRDQLEAVSALIMRLDELPGKEPAKAAGDADWRARLKTLESEADALRDRAEWAKRMVAKGFMNSNELADELKKVKAALDALTTAREEYRKSAGTPKKAAPADEKPKK